MQNQKSPRNMKFTVFNMLNLFLFIFSLFICILIFIKNYFAVWITWISLALFLFPFFIGINFIRSKHKLSRVFPELSWFWNIMAMISHIFYIFLLSLLLDYGQHLPLTLFIIYISSFAGYLWLFFSIRNQTRVAKKLLKKDPDQYFRFQSPQIEQLQEILKQESQISISTLASKLNIEEKIIYKFLFDWAEQFQFRINGDMVRFEKGKIDSFLSNLDDMFQNWETKSTHQSKKI